jgi:tetratricopeptide (TPR) repeat protein
VAAAPAPTPAEQQLATQIEARFEQLKKKDHFATLGVNQQATRDQVKASFLQLAKTFHPDRLPPSLPHLAQKMSGVFESIREAYETLYDDSRRMAYVATLAATRSSPSAVSGAHPSPAANQQANELFKMGEVYFKKRDYKQAEEHFARAHLLDRGASSLAAQAWAIYMDPTHKPEGPAARQLMQKALTLDANCDRAHYQLGVIARVEGDMDKAEKHFREAVRVNPRHLEASQELRLIEMRRKKEKDAAAKKGGGIFG